MRIILFTLFIGLSSILIAQKSNPQESIFSKEKISSVSEYFSSVIDLDLPEIKGSYSNDQAKIIFKTFLKQNVITSYEKKHSGGGNGRSNFEIGILKTAEKSYRTYMLYNLKDNKVEIIELRIEKV